jgi:hypothetical protein
MRDYSAPDLERLGETTAQLTAQAQSTRQRAAKEIARYRAQAERFKALASVTHLPKVQASRLQIAVSYERLAALAEGRLGLPQGSNGPTDHGRAPERARLEDLSNDDRRVASAALIGLSRALCDISTTLVRETREKLRRASAGDRSS